MIEGATVLPSSPPRGTLRVPGDKSISHRAFLVNLLGQGEAAVRGCNEGADVESTRLALRALGVSIVASEGGYRLRGRGGRLRPASDAIDCGNSGTTMRLLAGLLAAQPFTSTLDGDLSLRRRPMQRIAAPLRQMGARVEGPDNGHTPPLIISGARLGNLDIELPIASAQVKSCLLLAAAASGCRLRLREPVLSRDHTERMLRSMGANLQQHEGGLEFIPGATLHCVDVDVPGDPSAAALVAAVLLAIPNSELELPDLLLNPTRTGFLAVLERMGVAVQSSIQRSSGGEAIGALRLSGGERLRAVGVVAAEVPALIDEIPALAILAAFASNDGLSRFDGLAELRVKESDRLRAIVELLQQAGVAAQVQSDCLLIAAGQLADAHELRPADDHRIAMAAVALAAGIAQRRGHPVHVLGLASLAVSYPDFLGSLARCGVGLGA